MFKKLIAMALCFCMLVGYIPTGAVALSTEETVAEASAEAAQEKSAPAEETPETEGESASEQKDSPKEKSQSGKKSEEKSKEKTSDSTESVEETSAETESVEETTAETAPEETTEETVPEETTEETVPEETTEETVPEETEEQIEAELQSYSFARILMDEEGYSSLGGRVDKEARPGDEVTIVAVDGYVPLYAAVNDGLYYEDEITSRVHEDGSITVTVGDETDIAIIYGDRSAFEQISTYELYPEDEVKHITVNFMDDDGATIADPQYIVVNNGTVEGELTMVQVPNKTGKKFTGWAPDPFTTDWTTYSGNTMDAVAQYAGVLYVFFVDNEGRVVATKEGVAGDEIAADVTFPTDADKGITGWYRDAACEGEAVTSVTLESDNVTLYAKVESGNWITFNSNGGSYVDPIFVAPGTATHEPENPTRKGFIFMGWKLDDADYTFGNVITEDVTLTAQWQGTETTYTVVHWIENANDNGYTFKESETVHGIAGEMTAAAAKTYKITDKNLKGENVTDTPFKAQDIQQQEIAGDGTTVVQVKYSRKQYTLTFRKNSSSGSLLQTITLKYEQKIDSWPSYNVTWYDRGQKKEGTSSNWKIASKYYLANLSTMPMNGGTLWSYDASGSENRVNYMVQNLDLNGYSVHHTDVTIGTAGNSIGNEDKYDIEGFKFEKVLGSNGKPTSTYGGSTFYYTRNTYKIHYVNGDSELRADPYLFEADISGANIKLEDSQNPTAIKGAHFAGWYKDPKGLEPYSFDGQKMPAGDIIVYAKWTASSFEGTIHLSLNGDDIAKIEIPYGSTIKESDLVTYKPEIPDGYTWRGWCVKNGDVFTPFNFNTEIYGNIELWPYYTSAAKFHVSYQLGEGTGNAPEDTKDYAQGSYADVKSFSGTAPDDKVFLYWTDGNNQYYANDKVLIPDHNVELAAVYGPVPQKTTLTYHIHYPDGHSETDKQAYSNNEKITIRTAPTVPTGYEFKGWSKSADGEVAFSAGASAIINSVGNDLYAIWDRLTVTINYVAEGNGAVNPASENVFVVGQTPKGSVATPDNGYYFVNWTDANGNVVSTSASFAPEPDAYGVNHAATYTAHFAQKETYDITITGNTAGGAYKGSAYEATGFDVNGTLPQGVTVTLKDGLTAFASQTDVGTAYMGLTENSFQVNGAGEKYIINITEVTDGSVTVTPSTVTVTAETKSKTYGETDPELTATVSGLVGSDTIQYTLSRAEGEDVGTYAITPTGAAVQGNYHVTYKPGTFTITAQSIVPEDPSYKGIQVGYLNDVPYNAQDQKQKPSVTAAARAALVEGTDYTIGFSADTKNAGTVTVTVNGIGNYTGEVTRTYNITPAPLTITTNSATGTYNGKNLTAGGKIEGLQGDDDTTVKFTVTGAQKDVGSSKNTYSLEWNGVKEGNYDITEKLGTLTVKSAPESKPTAPRPTEPKPTEPEPTDPSEPSAPTDPSAPSEPEIPEDIPERETPLTDEIPDEEIPMAENDKKAVWALLNLILTILTCVASIVLLIGVFGKKNVEKLDENNNVIMDENGDAELEYSWKRKKFWKISSLIPAIGAVIAFILTEDMRNPMVFTDRWTLLMIVIAVIQVVVMFLAKKKKVKPEEEKTAAV